MMRDYRKHRQRQHEDSMKIIGFSVLMLFGALLIAGIWQLIEVIL